MKFLHSGDKFWKSGLSTFLYLSTFFVGYVFVLADIGADIPVSKRGVDRTMWIINDIFFLRAESGDIPGFKRPVDRTDFEGFIFLNLTILFRYLFNREDIVTISTRYL